MKNGIHLTAMEFHYVFFFCFHSFGNVWLTETIDLSHEPDATFPIGGEHKIPLLTVLSEFSAKIAAKLSHFTNAIGLNWVVSTFTLSPNSNGTW